MIALSTPHVRIRLVVIDVLEYLVTNEMVSLVVVLTSVRTRHVIRMHLILILVEDTNVNVNSDILEAVTLVLMRMSANKTNAIKIRQAQIQ